jgi:LPS export ABC transporter protein LptC
MKKSTIAFIIISSVLIVAGIVITVISMIPKHEPTITLKKITPESQDSTTTTACITIKNLIVRETLKNKNYRIIIRAQEGKVFHAQNKIECDNTTCHLWHKNVNIGYIFSQKAFIDKQAKEAFFSDIVYGNLEDLAFRTSNIHYDFANQTVSTDETITYTHPSFSVTAQKSRVDISKKEIHMDGGVRSEFFIKQK